MWKKKKKKLNSPTICHIFFISSQKFYQVYRVNKTMNFNRYDSEYNNFQTDQRLLIAFLFNMIFHFRKNNSKDTKITNDQSLDQTLFFKKMFFDITSGSLDIVWCKEKDNFQSLTVRISFSSHCLSVTQTNDRFLENIVHIGRNISHWIHLRKLLWKLWVLFRFDWDIGMNVT